MSRVVSYRSQFMVCGLLSGNRRTTPRFLVFRGHHDSAGLEVLLANGQSLAHILVVEDELSVLEVLQTTLEESYRVSSAGTVGDHARSFALRK
jgi:hypothetical protein